MAMQERKKVDCEVNTWLARDLVLKSGMTHIFAATADCVENHDVDDLWISAWTKAGWTAFPMENKSIMKYPIMSGAGWNPYFSSSNSDGIMTRISGNCITSGCHIYFVNAEDLYGNMENGKWMKMKNKGAGLCFIAYDGYLLFSPKKLEKALIGFAYYYNRFHTEQINKHYNPRWELKAIINLDKGTYYKAEPPKELFGL